MFSITPFELLQLIRSTTHSECFFYIVNWLFLRFLEKEKSGEKQSSGHSDRSSNNESVLKVEVRTNSSCSNQGSDEFDNSSDHVTPKLNGDSLYRYSDHFPDTFVPPPVSVYLKSRSSFDLNFVFIAGLCRLVKKKYSWGE